MTALKRCQDQCEGDLDDISDTAGWALGGLVFGALLTEGLGLGEFVFGAGTSAEAEQDE
ncbi:hypothetical protein GCM10010967_47270 [Dyadobacter beijingensis]|uniref:Class IIb bacteriocin, lactobin A/cerein 7B family n=1 Tax=Dyadobacter beijingensis TaxID=365489 RepID=A0ABQ2IF72_9BACT|nr:hypothetical protein GCM10010967_47270 [Dyadobacter beijingensis]